MKVKNLVSQNIIAFTGVYIYMRVFFVLTMNNTKLYYIFA